MSVYTGPLPDIAHFKGHGLTGAKFTCTACYRVIAMTWEKIGLPDSTPFPDIERLKRYACSTCGSKAITIMPDWSAYNPQGGG
jgi:hypothetical protein